MTRSLPRLRLSLAVWGLRGCTSGTTPRDAGDALSSRTLPSPGTDPSLPDTVHSPHLSRLGESSSRCRSDSRICRWVLRSFPTVTTAAPDAVTDTHSNTSRHLSWHAVDMFPWCAPRPAIRRVTRHMDVLLLLVVGWVMFLPAHNKPHTFPSP